MFDGFRSMWQTCFDLMYLRAAAETTTKNTLDNILFLFVPFVVRVWGPQ